MMVVGQVDMKDTKIFRDGALRDTDALSGYRRPEEHDYSGSPWHPGHHHRLPRRIDPARGVYNKSLTATQLQTLWAARAKSEG